MQTHDFFSRMIALNALGPNVRCAEGEKADISPVWICGACEASHENHIQAEDCCRPEVFSEYQCPTCKEGWNSKTDAADCCAHSLMPMQCPVCMRNAESFEVATDCCLHTHPSIDAYGRQRIAQAVASGATCWADAVENECKSAPH